MTKRIFRSVCIVAVAVLLASLTLVMGVLYDYFSGAQEEQLKNQTVLAAQGIVADAGLLLCLQVGGEVQQTFDLFGSVIKKLQKAAVRKIHCIYPSLCTEI